MAGTAPTIVLRGTPDGLEARPIYRYRTTDDGERIAVRTRRGLLKFDRVELRGADSGRTDPVALDEREKGFILGAERRSWRSIERRYGHDAWSRSVELACAGVVHLRCEVTHELELGQIIDWTLMPRWSRQRTERVDARKATRAETRQRALDAAASVEDICPALARALRETLPHTPALPGLIAVANDLRDGIVSASPRAFSQRHFGSTKVHDGVAHALERLDVPSWVADATGVRRSSRLGVAGQITVRSSDANFNAGAFSGPVTLRTDQPDLRLAVVGEQTALILVENLQAAETLADVRPDLAIVYTAGMPGRATLGWISRLAESAWQTFIATDADLGGVRIAEQLLEVAPAAQMIDVGSVPHEKQPGWPAESGYRRALERTVTGPASVLATAVLARGYALEQELLLVDALARVLPRKSELK